MRSAEKVRACKAARRARADFVKTSTGFASGGATAADVALMAEAVRGAGMGVKAAGGIRNLSDVKSMAAAGATRIGAERRCGDHQGSKRRRPGTGRPLQPASISRMANCSLQSGC